MAKYLTKQQVIADFIKNYIDKIHYKQYESGWMVMLDFLLKDKRISVKQHNTWRYPKDVVDEYCRRKERKN